MHVQLGLRLKPAQLWCSGDVWPIPVGPGATQCGNLWSRMQMCPPLLSKQDLKYDKVLITSYQDVIKIGCWIVSHPIVWTDLIMIWGHTAKSPIRNLFKETGFMPSKTLIFVWQELLGCWVCQLPLFSCIPLISCSPFFPPVLVCSWGSGTLRGKYVKQPLAGVLTERFPFHYSSWGLLIYFWNCFLN